MLIEILLVCRYLIKITKKNKLKLALGTVQFGIPYGINNLGGIPSDTEIKEIFKLADKSGIQILDTAPGYGAAENKIGQLSNQKFKIVTKFSPTNNPVELNNQLNDSLDKLKTKSVYAYLAHNADSLIAHPHLWQTLQENKQNKKIKKIGYSLYSCEQLEKLLELNFVPDIVQLPYSLLDRKFELFLPQLARLGTEIHTRSVFLQGLYFMNPSTLSEKLKPLKSNLQYLHQCCEKYNVSINSLALNFVLLNKYVSHIVIGVDNAFQLKQNIKMIADWQDNTNLIEELSNITVSNKELLNPANW